MICIEDRPIPARFDELYHVGLKFFTESATAGFFLACAIDANVISKGIATLVGSGVSNYNRAMLWGILWTGIGGIAGAFLARAIVQTFGKGLLISDVHSSTSAAQTTIAGAALWVILAPHSGLSASTTHAVLRSITGVLHGRGRISVANRSKPCRESLRSRPSPWLSASCRSDRA